jgi:lantibiotic modifying enzyme
MTMSTHTSAFDAALRVHCWLETQKRSHTTGINWPTGGTLAPEEQLNTYHGGAGVALFYLGLYQRTQTDAYLALAMQAGDYLVANLPVKLDTQRRHESSYSNLRVDDQPGLYFGIGGVGVLLSKLQALSGHTRYEEGARKVAELIIEVAEKSGSGVVWSDVRDITTGSAGIGITLLALSKCMDLPVTREFAIASGRRLLELAIPDGGGLRWEWEERERLVHPNFAHGAAGTGYYLLTLYQETGDKAFLDAALAGARYLYNVARHDGLICHSLNCTPDLFYLGWCHGPVGTGRFYYRLWETLGDAVWLDRLFQLAHAVVDTGIPDVGADGLWNNVGLCCGSAGVAEFFLDLYVLAMGLGRSDAQSYLTFARRIVDDILERGIDDDSGLRWTHAEHRTLPELLTTQVGYMQGAAGVGSVLLYFDALTRASTPTEIEACAIQRLRLPDSPVFRAVSR